MNAPPTEDRRPTTGAATGESLGGDGNSVRDTCGECGLRPIAPGYRFYCSQCLDEYLAGLERRHAAELRLPPVGVVV